jgi:hypothetical protein
MAVFNCARARAMSFLARISSCCRDADLTLAVSRSDSTARQLSTRAWLRSTIAWGRCGGLLGDLQLFAGQQRLVIAFDDVEDYILLVVVQLMFGRFVHEPRPGESMPARERIEPTPGTSEASREIAEGCGAVEAIQGEVCLRKALLPKMATKHIDGVVPPRPGFGERDVGKKKRPCHLRVGRGRARIGQRCLAEGVLFQSNPYRVLQSE